MNVSTTESTLENVFYSKKGAIAYVTPNRPEVLIALNHQAWAELRSQAEGLLSEASPFGLCAGTEDTNEGTRAFPQKHPVQFHARGTSNGEKEKSAVCYHPKGRFLMTHSSCLDRTQPIGPKGQTRIRVVRPEGVEGQLAVILYFHGAGWVMGDTTPHDRLVRQSVGGAP
jgi:hypothetical protein